MVATGEPNEGKWSVSDGRALQRFSDGVVVPAKGPQAAGRADVLAAAFSPDAAAAAAEAAAASSC